LAQGLGKAEQPIPTYRSYDWIVRIHLIPGLGNVQLDRLDPSRLRQFFKEKTAQGLSPATVKHIHATLRAALSVALGDQLIHQNIAKLVRLPPAEKSRPQVLDREGAKRLLAALADHPHASLFSVALSLGLRRGEIVGLRWRDVDLGAGELRVRSSLSRVKGNGLVLEQPKSQTSKRLLRLPKVCVAALSKRQKQQEQQKRWVGSSWVDRDYVFTNNRGGPLTPEAVTREFSEAISAAGLPVMRFQDLRHSCATLLLVQKVHPKLVQATLGHSSFQLTIDTNSHVN
jgi:integrase